MGFLNAQMPQCVHGRKHGSFPHGFSGYFVEMKTYSNVVVGLCSNILPRHPAMTTGLRKGCQKWVGMTL